MSRAGRLTSAADFRRTYASGNRSTVPAVVVHALDTREERPARIGVSASRGVRGAVERNRAKRRLREAIRPMRGSFLRGVDAVFVARPGAATAPFQELVDSVKASALKAGVLGE